MSETDDKTIPETKLPKIQSIPTPPEVADLIRDLSTLTTDKTYLIVDYTHSTDNAKILTLNSNLVLNEKLITFANNTNFNELLKIAMAKAENTTQTTDTIPNASVKTEPEASTNAETTEPIITVEATTSDVKN